MNKHHLLALAITLPACAYAQTAVDAYSASQLDLRGSARFMSMGGAFTALGGDISTLNQNPGGIGVYRSSDISLTLDLEPQSTKSSVGSLTDKNSQTKFGVNNFGYIGSVNTGSSAMPFFNWGVSFSRAASFDRRYGGRLGEIGTSYTNMVADYTTYDGFTQGDLLNNNPYFDSDAPWSSILMFDGFGINPTGPGANSYTGLFNYGSTTGEGWYDIEEKGHVDEYSLNFGGNVMNILYWGIGFGITDIDFKQYAYYGEAFNAPNVPSFTPKPTPDDPNAGDYGYYSGKDYPQNTGDYGLTNYKHIWGSGFNFKAGVIIKPVNEFRLGIAVHTPTYYNLSYEGNATMAFGYDSPQYTQNEANKFNNGQTSTEWEDFDWKLQTPWRFMVGAAGVIGGRAIISADYEYRAYSDMKVKDWNGNNYNAYNDNIKTFYKGVNIIHLGAEYRVTPAFSIRAGYSYESSPVQTQLIDPANNSEVIYVPTSGAYDTETQPSFTLDRSTNYITCGLGYRYKNFYADLAYVYRHRESDYQAFTNYEELMNPGSFVYAPKAKVTYNNSQLVLTLGVRF